MFSQNRCPFLPKQVPIISDEVALSYVRGRYVIFIDSDYSIMCYNDADDMHLSFSLICNLLSLGFFLHSVILNVKIFFLQSFRSVCFMSIFYHAE